MYLMSAGTLVSCPIHCCEFAVEAHTSGGVVGVPHRSYYLEKALDLLLARTDTQFVTSSEIADWFIKADGTGGHDLPAYAAPQP